MMFLANPFHPLQKSVDSFPIPFNLSIPFPLLAPLPVGEEPVLSRAKEPGVRGYLPSPSGRGVGGEGYTHPTSLATVAVRKVTRKAVPRVITTLKVAHFLLFVSL